MNNCIFCNIASGEMPSDIVYQDDKIVAFSDINPCSPVHVLVVPKEHVKSLDQVNDFALVSELMRCCVDLAKKLGLNEGYRVVVNTGVAGGQTVEHLHFHLLGGRNLAWPPG